MRTWCESCNATKTQAENKRSAYTLAGRERKSASTNTRFIKRVVALDRIGWVRILYARGREKFANGPGARLGICIFKGKKHNQEALSDFLNQSCGWWNAFAQLGPPSDTFHSQREIDRRAAGALPKLFLACNSRGGRGGTLPIARPAAPPAATKTDKGDAYTR